MTEGAYCIDKSHTVGICNNVSPPQWKRYPVRPDIQVAGGPAIP